MEDIAAFNILLAFLICILIICGYFLAKIVSGQSNRSAIITPGYILTLCISVMGFYTSYSTDIFTDPGISWYYAIAPLIYLSVVASVFNWKRSSEKKSETDNLEESPISLLTLFSIIIIIYAGVILFYISKLYIGNDEGSYIYEIHLISQGLIPFKDFISRAPAEIATFFLFSKIFGVSIFSFKLFNASIFTLTGIVTYLFMRRSQKNTVALISTLAILTTPAFFLTKIVFSTTILSTFFIICSCFFVTMHRRYADLLTGVLLALAVFTRESNALFVLGLLIYLALTIKEKRDTTKIILVILGGLLVSVPTFVYFSGFIGIQSATNILLGIGHVGVNEAHASFSFSLAMLGFFFISIAPFIVILISTQKRNLQKKEIPLLLWIIIMALFYGWYFEKRSFMLSYGSEFIPLIGIICLSFPTFSARAYAKKYIYYTSLIVAFILLLLPYAYIVKPQGDKPLDNTQLPLDRLIGSGIPLSQFNSILTVIRTHSSPADTILSGNLALASESGLTQFMNITRPTAYEGESNIFTLYKKEDKATIVSKLLSDPPRIIVNDHHLFISLFPDIQDLLQQKYTQIYSDEFASVFVLNTTNK